MFFIIFSITSLNILNTLVEKYINGNNTNKDITFNNSNEKTYLPILVNNAAKKIPIIDTNKLFLIKLSFTLKDCIFPFQFIIIYFLEPRYERYFFKQINGINFQLNCYE